MIRCDCGYECVGSTDDDVITDARRHALEAHGIDVPAARILEAAASADDGDS